MSDLGRATLLAVLAYAALVAYGLLLT